MPLSASVQAAQDLMQTMKTVMGQRARGQEREIKISEARSILEDVETERLVSEETVHTIHNPSITCSFGCKYMYVVIRH